MQGDSDERLRERLAALRRITVKRGATKAEAATAKRLADQLAARLGKRPRRGRRKGPKVALPEPSRYRRKRLWLFWLEAGLEKIVWAIVLLKIFWVATLPIAIGLLVFAHDDLRKQVENLYFARALLLMAGGLVLGGVGAALATVVWWLRTLPGERLRGAVLGREQFCRWFPS